MVLRGRGGLSEERPPLPLSCPSGLLLPLPRLSHAGSKPTPDERGLAKAFPADGGMKRSGKPKRGTWAYPELKNAQGTKKNGRHCSDDWL